MKKIQYVPWIAVAGVIASVAIAGSAFAQTNVGVSAVANVGGVAGVNVQGGFHDGANGGVRRPGGPAMMPGIFGSITAISGTTLTVTATNRNPGGPMIPAGATTTISVTPTIYTVDASNAKIYKDSASSTVSIGSIATGDMVFVQGTVSGTNVTATVIRDGMGGMMRTPGMWGGHDGSSTMGNGSSTMHTSPITGNGEPVVGGSITAISGTTLTVTNGSNVTYTIDASSAKIVKNNTTTAFSNLVTGDDVIVQGTVNGTSITATSVIDSGSKDRDGSATSGASGSVTAHAGFGLGFLGAIGGFFKHLFGF